MADVLLKNLYKNHIKQCMFYGNRIENCLANALKYTQTYELADNRNFSGKVYKCIH